MSVINHGYIAYNTRNITSIQEGIFKDFVNTQFATLFLGANDATKPPSPAHVDVQEFKENLLNLGKTILSKTPRLVIITPPFINERDWPDRSNQITNKYRLAAIDVARSLEVPFLDLWPLFLGNTLNVTEQAKEKYLIDGLHLTADGNDVVYRGFVDLLHNNWPEI
jgi:lysophospholipase L1-like esterase